MFQMVGLFLFAVHAASVRTIKHLGMPDNHYPVQMNVSKRSLVAIENDVPNL